MSVFFSTIASSKRIIPNANIPTPISPNLDYSDNSTGFFNNIYNVASSGFMLRSSFAEVAYTTDHTSVDITWHTKSYQSPPTYINIFIDDVFYQTVTPSGVAEYSTETVSLPVGSKKVLIRQGSTFMSPLQGFDITNISFSGGSTVSVYTPARKSKRMVTTSDSIGVGAGTTNNGLKGWQMLLREQKPEWEFVSVGAAGAEASIVTTTGVQDIVDYLSGATVKVVWFSLGANDFGSNTEVWRTRLEDWVDAINASDNTIKIVLQTMIYREDYETQLNVLRQIERDVASTRTFCEVIEAESWIPTNEYYPDPKLVHPNDTGNATYAQKVRETFIDLN